MGAKGLPDNVNLAGGPGLVGPIIPQPPLGPSRYMVSRYL
jgi:hypothetical protein